MRSDATGAVESAEGLQQRIVEEVQAEIYGRGGVQQSARDEITEMIRRDRAAVRRATLEEISGMIGERVRIAKEQADCDDVFKAASLHCVALAMTVLREDIRALLAQEKA
jgi:hypothetical protein